MRSTTDVAIVFFRADRPGTRRPDRLRERSTPALTPLETSSALQPAAPRVNSVIPGDRERLTVFESRGAGSTPILPPLQRKPLHGSPNPNRL